jgi:hypothetical protein
MNNDTTIDDTDDPGNTDEFRTWYHEELPGPPGRGDVVVVMKNPSWPDEGNVCITEARRMGIECAFSNLYVANLFGRRSRHPGKLNCLPYEEAVVEGNDGLLALMAGDVELVVAAWGNANGIRASWYRRRVTEVVELLGPDRFTSFGTTGLGQPRHCYSWRFGRQVLQEWRIDQVQW